MPSGHLAEHETLITTGSGSHPLSVQLGLGIQSRGAARGSNEDPSPPLLSSVENLYVIFVVLLQFNKTVNNQ